jgi:hypothetical protein
MRLELGLWKLKTFCQTGVCLQPPPGKKVSLRAFPARKALFFT